jgi:hypothetical protein
MLRDKTINSRQSDISIIDALFNFFLYGKDISNDFRSVSLLSFLFNGLMPIFDLFVLLISNLICKMEPLFAVVFIIKKSCVIAMKVCVSLFDLVWLG